MQEKKGITHINMMDLLQQYALGNDMQDFGQLSSKTVAEVLMLEIKMSPGAKVFLVSGYPRNMRDVVEYAEKIKIVNGVILVSWRQEILERQIDFGAQLGQVVIELARMELYNFYRNVMPVAEYFDQSGMLLEVNGERNPNDVYVDFREAVFKILGLSTDDTKERNVPPSLEAEVEVERRKESISKSPPPPRREEPPVVVTPLPPVITEKPVKTASKPRKGLPSFIWIIGGPGSNKDNLCSQAVRNMPGWVHVSISSLLRTMATSNTIVKDAIICGELVPQDIVMQVLEQQIILNRDTDGVIIDGYPRDLTQVEEFQNKFGQQPPLVLLDCSKLQLGRGRLDDSVSAFKKRLDLFRELSLPMLKTLDNESRLTIIDGDTDVPSVQQEFAAALYQLMTQSRRKGEENHAARSPLTVDNGNLIGNNRDQILPNGVLKEANNEKPSIENAMNAMNGLSFGGAVQIANGLRNNLKQIQKNGVTRVQNGVANGAAHILQNGVAHLANGIAAGNNKVAPAVQNYVPNDANDAIRKMYNEVEGYQQNLHM
nr:adenylate kinase isoenzyme 5 isoform X4 [Nomia melanderi]XP_031846426.1 adenylate kinase isoenzyme 5 isoform X4 [Nomia melanderi]XP_031846427.1 adenylate kinase isoenzyme 5 isoform X4 [Nomia melanderi]